MAWTQDKTTVGKMTQLQARSSQIFVVQTIRALPKHDNWLFVFSPIPCLELAGLDGGQGVFEGKVGAARN
jgi:hypothetical protein